MSKPNTLLVTAFVYITAFFPTITHAADPLPSWNDTAPKKAIIAFVEKVTKEGSADFVPSNDFGVAGIVVEPTDDLIRFQRKLIDAVAPYTVKTGTAAAFATTKEDPDIIPPLIGYVADFVPNSSGEKFNPHVTVGVSSQEYLKKMLVEPFAFSPVGVSVYQLGNFGTARTKLKSW